MRLQCAGMTTRGSKADASAKGESREMVERSPLEREVLRRLCARETTAAERADAAKRLAGYAWRSEDCGVVFEAMAKCPGFDAEGLRAELPALVTRKGFPEIEWAEYFAEEDPGAGREGSLRALIEQVLAGGRAGGR